METLVSICRMCGPLKLLSLCNIWSLHLYRSQSFFKLLCTNSSGSLFMHFKQVILLALITEKFPSILDIAVVKNQLSNLSFIKLLNVQALSCLPFMTVLDQSHTAKIIHGLQLQKIKNTIMEIFSFAMPCSCGKDLELNNSFYIFM